MRLCRLILAATMVLVPGTTFADTRVEMLKYCSDMGDAAEAYMYRRIDGKPLEQYITELVSERRMESIDEELFVIEVSQAAVAYAMSDEMIQGDRDMVAHQHGIRTQGRCQRMYDQ